MKKNIFVLLLVCLVAFVACEKPRVSFLNAKNLTYPINSMTIVKGLTDEDKYLPPHMAFPPGRQVDSPYKARIENKSPWRSESFYGGTVEGARPLEIKIESIRTEGDQADGERLKQVIKIIGEGVFEVPYENDIPEGKYHISLRISNISGLSEVVTDCFTIIVTTERTWR